MPAISLNGQSLTYTVFRRKNNKYVRLSVTKTGLIRVSVPWHYPNKFIPGVIRRYGDWVLNHVSAAEHRETLRQWPYREGAALPFMGKSYTLRYEFHTNGNAELRLRDGTAQIDLPAAYRRGMNKEGVDDFIAGWYRHQAHRYIPRRTEELAREMAVRYSGIRLKDLRSRWGSCSERKNLNFNIRLMMLPKSVIDYVIIHELAHLRQLNHSPKFWRIVAAYCPRYESLRAQLREYSALLTD